MTLADYNAALEDLGRIAVSAAPDGWQCIAVTLSGLANATTVRADVDGQSVSLGAEGARAAHRLRKMMYSEGAGAWYRATLTVDAQRHLKADFDYSGKPYAEGEDATIVRELLLQDHAKYPRDQALLPDWHPAKR